VAIATLAISATAAAAGGLVPVLGARDATLQTALRETARSQSASRRTWTRMLTVAQVAISLVLLCGALLLARSMVARQNIDPGFDPAGVAVFSVDPATQGYDATRTHVLYQRLLGELRALPGVRAAAYIWMPPFVPSRNEVQFRAGADGSPTVTALSNSASDGYFQALGVPVIEGRDFLPSEVFRFQAGSAPGEVSAIVTQSFARDLFGRRPAVGRRFEAAQGNTSYLIVGVVPDIRYVQLTAPPDPMVFTPAVAASRLPGNVVVGTSWPAQEVASRARAVIAESDPALPIYDVRTLADEAATRLVDDRLVATLASVFAILAVIVAAIGLHSVLARAVAERRRELSIRVALGAAPAGVARLVVSDAVRTGLAGAAIGLAASWWLARYLESWLFGVMPWDPVSFSGALVLAAAAVLLSALAPARRAARLDFVAELK
jgi:predicted permease